MKKIVAFVLALVMVLGMATVAFAADPKVEVSKWDLVNNKVTLKVSGGTDALKVSVGDYWSTPVTMDAADLYAANGAIEYTFSAFATKIAYSFDNWATFVDIKIPAPDMEVVGAVKEAVDMHRDTIEIALMDLDEENVMTAEDWAYLLNNGMFVDNAAWWNKGFQYLDMNIKLYGFDAEHNTVIYYIAAGDIDYTWTKEVDFTMTNGLTGYKDGAQKVYAAIRKLTGDATKNPYTFGWVTGADGKVQAVPDMTISVVIPQQWLNVYGSKDLTLWAYDMENEVKCEVCGAVKKDPEAAKLAEDTADANAQTQRVVLSTDTLYKTLVLSTVAVEAEAKATDANPNTGANDIVNVAIVLSVISLVAAGAFVFSKQR